MKKQLIITVFVLGIISLFTNCSTRVTKQDKNTQNASEAKHWAQAADSCTFVLVEHFLNKEKGTFRADAREFFPERTQLLYWQQAHLMDVLVYAYERVKDSDSLKATEYENYFRLWMQNRANNWYDWKSDGDTTGFLNEMVDDMAWIILTMQHMAAATKDTTYYYTAQTIYEQLIIPQAIQDEKGWSFPWKINGRDNSRLICTNAPICLAACRFYNITGEAKFLRNAIDLYDFIIQNLWMEDGRLEEPPLTYTQGTFAEAARLLFHITGEQDYMDKAVAAVDYTITSNRCVDRGLLRHEGNDDDQGIFKAIFIPYAVNLALDEDTPYNNRLKIKTFLLHNAETLWFRNMERTTWPDMYAGFYWGEPYTIEKDKNLTAYASAHASGASLLENVARMMNNWKQNTN